MGMGTAVEREQLIRDASRCTGPALSQRVRVPTSASGTRATAAASAVWPAMSDESDALQLVRAKHAYAPNGDGQIALQQGEVRCAGRRLRRAALTAHRPQLVCDALAVHKDWMRGTNSLGDHGLFPKAYVMPLRTLVRPLARRFCRSLFVWHPQLIPYLEGCTEQKLLLLASLR